jgi:hypothetical protein
LDKIKNYVPFRPPPIFLLVVTIGFLVGVIGDTIVFEGSALAWIATPA